MKTHNPLNGPRSSLRDRSDERYCTPCGRQRGKATARLARAGKPTIYARFPNKEALYAAVVMRNVASVAGRFEDHIPAGTTIEERLTDLGATFLDRVLVADTSV